MWADCCKTGFYLFFSGVIVPLALSVSCWEYSARRGGPWLEATQNACNYRPSGYAYPASHVHALCACACARVSKITSPVTWTGQQTFFEGLLDILPFFSRVPKLCEGACTQI